MTRVSEARLNTIELYARQAGKPWLCVDVVEALRELRTLRQLVREADDYMMHSPRCRGDGCTCGYSTLRARISEVSE